MPGDEKRSEEQLNRGRRDFTKAVLTSALGGGTLLSGTLGGCSKQESETITKGAQEKKRAPWRKRAGAWSDKPGIKIGQSHMRNTDLTDEMIAFLKQLGVDHIEGWVTDGHDSYQDIVNFRDRLAKEGITLQHCGFKYYNSNALHLGLPERDKQITEYQQFIKNLGKAGIPLTIYAWTPSGLYQTGMTTIRDCETRLFDYEEAKKAPFAFDREFSKEEIWDNYIYFIKKMLPVAEDAGVRLALHPGDPPCKMSGIPRIFDSNEAYRRAFEISNHSPYSGILFCLGTWGEMFGPSGKGEDIIGAIHEFGEDGLIYEMHFRNVSSPLPVFHETFMDNGYIDMYAVVQALLDIDFNGVLVPDHVPTFLNEKIMGPIGVSGTPYSVGYMRALINRAYEEAGISIKV